MMTKLRQLSAVFLWILVFAFLGLMVFEWGMDYTGQGRRQNVVGSVNGEELSYEMFSDMYQQLFQNERARVGKDLNDSQLQNLRNQVWEQFIQQVLFKKEIEELGITVSDSEIVYQIKNYPLDEFRNNPAFQTDGTFDWNKYYASFSNPNIPWMQIEEFYRMQLPNIKLQNIITNAVRVSDSEVKDEIYATEAKAKIDYLELAFSKFNDANEEISDEEATAYYNAHLDEYHQKEMRQLSFVLFPLTPSKADTQRVLDEFDEIKALLAEGRDFNELAKQRSDDPAVKNNDGRYDFFERGAMVKPFEDASFNGNVGDIVGPVETRFGYHLIKIEDKRKKDGKDQVKVSHILFKLEAGPTTREQAESAAAFFAEDARSEGFTETAATNSYEVQQIPPIAEAGSFIPGFGQNFQIINFAFRANLNDVSNVIESDRGFAVFMLESIQPEGPRPFEDVKNLVVSKVRLNHATDRAREYANAVQEKINQGMSLKDIADSDTENLRFDSPAPFSLKGSVPRIGTDKSFNATAFALQAGTVSAQVETRRGIYWQQLTDKTEPVETVYEQQFASVQERLLAQKRNQAFMDWYNYLKDNAEIEDNRKLFNL